MTHFFVEGTPKAQPRHRQGQFGAYTPDSVKGWRELIWIEARKHRPPEPHLGPVSVMLTFVMPRPKSHFRTNGQINPKYADVRHTKKPDADNMLKAVKDELEQIGYYKNDSQIWRIHAEKTWADLGQRSGMNITVELEKKP